MKRKSSFPLIGLVLLTLCFATGISAQSVGTIDAGTTITVRTNEEIKASNSDGRVFSGVVDQDVLARRGSVAIPKGSNVELLVRSSANNQVALDLDAVTVNGQRYSINTDDSVVDSERADGLGANKRTGKYVGGGAAIGAIIGAIAGGGKGAAIGGGIGAAAGAGTQVLTRGKSVNVPAESLVTFRLQQPLRTGVAADSRFGRTYSGDTAINSTAYRDGLRAGRSDADRNLARNMRSSRWTTRQQIRDYQAGYNAGYDRTSNDSVSSNVQQGYGSVRIGTDNNVSWQGPVNARLYVQVDNNPRQLFASGASGTQQAPWMSTGHLYVFVLQDANGNEIARDQYGLRRRTYR